MSLGNQGSLGRCLLVWLVAGPATVLPTAPVVRLAVSQWHVARRQGLDRVPLDIALLAVAAVAVVACAAWAWLAVTVEVLEAARGRTRLVARGHARLPRGARRLVLAACGVALAGGVGTPALAHDAGRPHGRHAIAGLPLPERAVLPGRAASDRATTARPARTVVVQPGDSLWSIATADLPPGASAALVTAHWHTVYAANRAVIGSDPDLIEPGQHLHLPGKDRS
ncbi:MAG TPA: LysM peptidoglycan-binding domain-containing protein [Nocardioides sp.]|nr:LysM peptidoglycan-binding domain-containing protein [Nocardioides sp.]